MGLILIFGLGVYFLVATTVLLPLVLSIQRCRKIPYYWVVAGVASVVSPFLLLTPKPTLEGGTYGGANYFMLGAFSLVSLYCFAGAVVSLILVFPKSDRVRIFSGVIWGFFTTYCIWIVGLF